MSLHGGSPPSGLVAPAGLDSLKPAEGSLLVAPDIVRRKEEAKARARQFERRRIALELLSGLMASGFNSSPTEADAIVDVKSALLFADELLRQTGDHVTGVASE